MRLPALLARRTVWITALSLAWLAALALDLVPEIRGGSGWRWPFEPVLDASRIAPFILGVLLYVPVALALQRRPTARGLLLWALAGGIGLSLAAVHVRGDVPFRLFTVTLSGGPGGWHLAATRIQDFIATLRNWPQFMADSVSFSSHMGISPPGMVTIYYGLDEALARVPGVATALARPLRAMQCQSLPFMEETNAQLASAWLGMLMPLWGSLTVFPLYRLGRSVFGEEPARWSVLWWPLIPSFLIFAPLPNTLYPLPAILMILMLFIGLRRDQPGWVFAAGLLMSCMTFVTFTFSPLLLLAGFLALGMYWRKRGSAPAERLPWTWPIRMGLWYGLGLVVVWAVVYLASGLTVWDVLREATRAHLDLHRRYLPWLILHINDFFMFTGWPLTLLAGTGVALVVRRLARKQAPGESDVMVVAAVLALIVLDLSGTLRGESGRILLFLSPWLLLAAGAALGGDRRLARALTVVQALTAIVMIVCLRVLDAGLEHPPAAPPPPAVARAADAQVIPSGAVFGDVVRLQSFSGRIEMRADAEGGSQPVLLLWLDWEPLAQADIPYYLAILPVAPGGESAPEAAVLQPFRQQYPATCWMPGAGVLQDQVEVPLFAAEDGDWWVSLRLVDARTGEALDVVNPDGSRDAQAGLGPVR